MRTLTALLVSIGSGSAVAPANYAPVAIETTFDMPLLAKAESVANGFDLPDESDRLATEPIADDAPKKASGTVLYGRDYRRSAPFMERGPVRRFAARGACGKRRIFCRCRIQERRADRRDRIAARRDSRWR
ncbi:MAG: hypothetical protein AAGA92_16175 [Planctomycetota bacterium]